MSIILRELTKRFGSQLIVDHVSLEVADRELFVLLGASGSGKSTILRMIAGLAMPDEGQILLQGRDVTQLAPQERGTGFVFQNYTIFKHMTVAQNIGFGLKIRKTPRAERERRVEQLLDLVGLGGLGGRYAHQLSGGQQQRVALARALAYEPAVLLLDEPFGALDVKIRSQLRKGLKEIQRRLKVTMILVTHDQEEAFELADRIGVLERGHLVEVGLPEQLYCRPRTIFAATFLGAGNLLVGRALGGNAVLGPLSLPLADESPHEEGARTRVLFRPEQVLVSDQAPAEGGGSWPLGQGRIVEDTFAGSIRRLRLRLPRLPGTRQVSPTPPFGEDGLLIDATLPAGSTLATQEPWISLRGYHVLQQEPWRLLLESSTKSPLVGWLAERLGAELLAQDQLQAPCDLRLMVAASDRDEILGQATAALAPAEEMPVLVDLGGKSKIESILVCTAIGEPGKRDVMFGGRLARRLGAAVTLFHCVPLGEDPAPRVLVHLQQSMGSLRALDIQGRIRLQEAENPAAGILREAERRDYDLVVIGARPPRQWMVPGRPDVLSELIRSLRQPILIVPSLEP